MWKEEVVVIILRSSKGLRKAT